MGKTYVSTNKAPKAIGPYSQGIKTGEFVNNNIEEETNQSLENLKSIIEEAGGTLEDIVKVTIFITSMENFSKINKIYGGFFGSHKPARSCIEISKLPNDGNVEIEAIAIV